MSKRKVSVEDKIYAVNLYLDGKVSLLTWRCIGIIKPLAKRTVWC